MNNNELAKLMVCVSEQSTKKKYTAVCPHCHTIQCIREQSVIKRGCSICGYPVAKQGAESSE